jgi:uncharacterized membrane protein
MFYIALGLAVTALLALFALAYYSGEDIRTGLARTGGQLIAAGVFVGVLVGSLLSMKLLIKSRTSSKVLFALLVIGALLAWYEYEAAGISQYFR